MHGLYSVRISRCNNNSHRIRVGAVLVHLVHVINECFLSVGLIDNLLVILYLLRVSEHFICQHTHIVKHGRISVRPLQVDSISHP